MIDPGQPPPLNLPRVMAFVGAIVSCMILAIGLAIGGSYLLTLRAIHQANATQASLRAREAVANLRSAIPECEALIALDDARVGAIFPKYGNGSKASAANGYGFRLAGKIHGVVTEGGCYIIVDGLKKHQSLEQIQKELNAAHR